MAHKLMRLVVLFLIPLGSYSQLQKTFSIGDAMPSMTFSNIFAKPGTSISLNDYKGKLIILDFWNRWCGSCIEAFPKMEKLQSEFGDKIKILLVTSDKDEAVSKLFKRFKLPSLTIISNDSILNNMFPHIAVPHHVWINPDGRVQFITDGYNATKENISKVLNGQNVQLHLKNEVTDVDEESDLWKEGNGRLQKYINNYSFAMRKVNEIGSTNYAFIKDTINRTCGFRFVNTSLLDIYKIAFGGSVILTDKDFAYSNRIQFDCPSCFDFFQYPGATDSIPAWEERNLVCYESKWKLNNDSLAYQYLQSDANKFFPFSVRVENIETPCYILKKINGLSNSKEGNKEKYLRYTGASYLLKNMPVSVLVKSLNGITLFKKMPIVDETNFSSNIDIHLTNAFSDIEVLTKQLLKNGLLLELSNRKMKILVIDAK